jgi:pimeloyl-ACP methyl ester carboxylesterase
VAITRLGRVESQGDEAGSREGRRSDVGVVTRIPSADGTMIGYRSVGHGPGLIVVHGALESGADYMDLATAVADTFTVHLLDRRGRGLSDPHTVDHGLATEVDDLAAVITATGARHLFGVSSGGVIVLRASLEIRGIDRVAVYEPALSLPGGDSRRTAKFVGRYEQAIAQGRTAEAIVALLKATSMGPRWLRFLPAQLAVRAMRRVVGGESAGTPSDGGSAAETFAGLVPTMRYDFLICDQGLALWDRFEALSRPVLLLGGDESPRTLGEALAALEQRLPRAGRVQLRGVGHNAASNGGRPGQVAHELVAFLTPESVHTPQP